MTEHDSAAAPGPELPEPGVPEAPAPGPEAPLAPPADPPTPGPLVAWDQPAPSSAPPPAGVDTAAAYAGGPPAFTVGALISDVFAIYGADALRFFAVALVTSAVTFIGSLSGTPFGPAGIAPGSNVAGILSLIGFVVGLVGGAAVLALADGGPSMPMGRVLRRAVERSGWVFLTSLLIGIGFVAIAIVPVIVIILIALVSPALAGVLMVVAVLLLIWLGLRLTLAIPGNVADNLNSIDALRLSWRATRRSGVWGRLIGASLLVGLLVLPAVAGIGFAAIVATLGSNAVALLAASLALAFLTPLTTLIGYAAYRRLVAPIEPWWAEPAGASQPAAPTMPEPPIAGADGPPASGDASIDAPVVPAGRTFGRRPFAVSARVILALVIVLDFAGILAIGWAGGEVAAGRVRLPSLPTTPGAPFPGLGSGSGAVAPGTVAFGTAADLSTCTVDGQNLIFSRATPVVWLAAFERPVADADEVFLHVTRDGVDVETTLQPAGSYDCLGIDDPVTLDRGTYVFELIVNGGPASAGLVIVQ